MKPTDTMLYMDAFKNGGLHKKSETGLTRRAALLGGAAALSTAAMGMSETTADAESLDHDALLQKLGNAVNLMQSVDIPSMMGNIFNDESKKKSATIVWGYLKNHNSEWTDKMKYEILQKVREVNSKGQNGYMSDLEVFKWVDDSFLNPGPVLSHMQFLLNIPFVGPPRQERIRALFVDITNEIRGGIEKNDPAAIAAGNAVLDVIK